MAVYGLPDPRGVGDQLVAAIVPRHDSSIDPAGFEDFLAAQSDLSPKAWPRWARIAEELPTTATNEILKRELVSEGVGQSAVGAGGASRDTWWERDERGTEYTVMAGAVAARTGSAEAGV